MIEANITKNTFTFPPTKKEKTIETGFMREVMNRTMAIHPGNAVWYGESRIGKTTTAKHFVSRINENHLPDNPNSFRAVHFEAGEIAGWSGNEQKKGLKSLYNATIGRIDEGSYRTDPIESIVENLVYGLKRKNIQKVFIDEAGNLSLDAIRGIMMTYDAAKSIDHNLSLIFIGMDDLPTKVTKLPQINGRINEWCYFEKYTLKEIAVFLKEFHPYFTNLDFKKAKSLELVECIYELYDGFPGLIIPFLNKVENYLQINPQTLTVKILRMVHMRTNMDKSNSINKSLRLINYFRASRSIRWSAKIRCPAQYFISNYSPLLLGGNTNCGRRNSLLQDKSNSLVEPFTTNSDIIFNAQPGKGAWAIPSIITCRLFGRCRDTSAPRLGGD
jgi:hypothetical protein